MNRMNLRPSPTAHRALAGLALLIGCVLTPAASFAQATYHWVQIAPGHFPWSDPNSWSPLRVTPAPDDILIFDGTMIPGGLAEVDVDVPSEIFGQLVVSNGAVVKLATSPGTALTMAGGAGLDLHVQTGTTLELDGAFGLPITLMLAAGATGQVDGGAVVISTAPGGRLLATSAGALHFLSGSRMETNPGHSGSVFGNTGTSGTVVFENGSTYLFRTGANPFGSTQPASKVVFQTGSVYRHESTFAPSVAGRTYADFELNVPANVTAGGTTLWTFDNLRVIQGSLNVTANQPISVRNDITVSSGATFNYAPAAGATMTFGGTVVQTISCPNNLETGVTGLNLGANATLTTSIGHAGLTVSSGDLNPTGTFSPQTKVTCTGTGRVIMGPTATLSPSAAGWIHGPLGRRVATGGPVNVPFPVGTAALRSDVTLSFANVSAAGHVIVSTASGDHPALSGSGLDPLKSVNRAWTIRPATGSLAAPTFTTASATLTYDGAEIDGSATPANFIVGKRDGGTWTLPTHGPGGATSIEATGLTSFSDFAVAEPSSCPAITVLPASLPGGTTGTPYAQTITASGGVAPYTFAVTFGTLPPGLTLATNGDLTGTPTSPGVFNFTVTATDVASCAGATAYTVTITGACPAITVTPGTLGDGTVGIAYNQALAGNGGTAPYTFAVTAGALPPGLALSAAGALTGTPTAAGTFAFTVTATDAASCTGDQAYSLSVNCPPISVFPTFNTNGTVGAAYNVTHSGGGGTAPYTFSITAGSLPPGLALASGGALTGTPTTPGPYNFTVTATDAFGCTGNRAYSVIIGCPTITALPASLPDGVVGTPYNQTLTGSGGTAPYSFAVTGGSLPAGLTLALGGSLTGTPTSAGAPSFTVTVTDANGCVGSVGYTITVVIGDRVEPGVPPSCISTATPCVLVPVVFTRVNTTPALAYSVTVELSSNLALCGPGFTSAGYLPSGAGGTAFLVTPAGPNTWTIDESTLGPPCGATGSGTLFYVHVTTAGPTTGTGAVAVIAASVRDCSNAPIPAPPSGAGAAIAVTIDLVAPAAVANVMATPQLTGNDADGTRKIALAFTSPLDAVSTQVWRKGFGGYPQYDENGGSTPVAPANPTAAASAGWSLTTITASGQIDEPAARDFWHYVLFSTDACGNVSAVSNLTTGTLNYHLGDVHNSVATCAGDNAVGTPDVSFLGAHYFAPIPVNDPRECLDVGPTTDLSPEARPSTDNVLNFEDLILFGINYGQVSAPALAVTPAVVEGDASALWIEAPAQVMPGDRVRALVRMRGAGDLQGLSARLGWNAAVVEPRAFESGGWLETDDGVVFGAGPGGVDAALLGVRGHGIHGEGTLAILTFEARAAGNPGFRIAQVQGRDAANRRRSLAGAPGDVIASAPARTAIELAFPNPFTQRTSVQLSLVRAGHVKLVAFDLGGRMVRTLVDGNLEAGRHSVTWDGRSDAGAQLAPGAYVVRLETGEVVQSRQISIVR